MEGENQNLAAPQESAESINSRFQIMDEEVVQNPQREMQEKKLWQHGMKIAGMLENADMATSLIERSFLRNVGEEQRVIVKLKNKESLEGSDFLTTASSLSNAEFSAEEIEDLLVSAQEGTLRKVIEEKIVEENTFILERVNSSEFLREAGIVSARINLLALRLGVEEQVEDRWPTIIYSGKTARMLRRTSDVEVFDPHACVAGEYVHESKSAYITLLGNTTELTGKEFLKLQTHEVFHGISRNNVTAENSIKKDESGLGTFEIDRENPLESKYRFLGFNEGLTEYLARMMTKESFAGEDFLAHAYDDYVAGVSATIRFIAEDQGKDVDKVEEELFKLYIDGDKDRFINLISQTLGEAGSIILDILPRSIDSFFAALGELKQKGHTDMTFEIDFHSLPNNISIANLKKEYPFLRIMRDEINLETYDTKKIEVLE